MEGQTSVGRKIEAHEIYSSHLQEVRTVKVMIPQGDVGQSPLPVLYCHDGLEFFTHGRIATIATRMMEEGLLRPLVIVGIAVSKTYRTEEYASWGNRHEAYSRFVVEEVLPFIEEMYAVDTKRPLMAGISLGATATLSLAMQYPTLFTKLLLFSGAYFTPILNAAKLEESFSNAHIFMRIGEQETDVKISDGTFHDFLQPNRTMRAILEEKGATVAYGEAEGTHIWGFWQGLLPDALQWIEQTEDNS